LADIRDALRDIDRQELTDLALALGNIESPTGSEGPAGEFVYDWLLREGFEPRRHALIPDRFGVSATLAGSGGGCSLIFNSHLDTTLRRDAIWKAANPEDPQYHSAWLDGDEIVGDGVVNDKGLMAAFLVAAKAIKRTGVPLRGDLILTAAPGEISREPVDEFQGVEYLSKDLGTRFMIEHGVVADYALVAEGTGFGIVWVEAGKAHFKLTLVSEQPTYYTPYLPRPTSIEESPNAIVRATRVVQAFEEWAYEYERRNTQERESGVIVPKMSINAIRSGYPYNVTSTPQICSLYVDGRILPGANPLDIRDELRALLASVGEKNARVELFLYRRGYEAQNIGPLVDAVRRCHDQVFTEPPKPVAHAVSSMWRDTNMFNQMGIPALSYGPRSAGHASRRSFKLQSLYQTAEVYARIAVDVCNLPRPRGGRQA
jgi:acetylornithine deacetylase/succinyl-diaminopimelate desuccinylase-like protein